MGIGKRLEDLLEQRNRNVNSVARSINVSPSTIYGIIRRDNNKVELDVLQRIADELGVTLDYFASNSSPTSFFSIAEQEHIKKYRRLPHSGKRTVDNLIENLLAYGIQTEAEEHPIKGVADGIGSFVLSETELKILEECRNKPSYLQDSSQKLPEDK